MHVSADLTELFTFGPSLTDQLEYQKYRQDPSKFTITGDMMPSKILEHKTAVVIGALK
jgi:hypothetical protein